MPIALEQLSDNSMTDRNFRALASKVNPPLPQARVFNSASISLVNSTLTALTFDSERFDSGAMHSTTTNTGRLTAPITGLYLIGANVEFASNSTGYRAVEINHSGGSIIASQIMAAVNGTITVCNPTGLWHMLAGEYAIVNALQTSGGALNVTVSTARSPEFWMVRLGGFVNGGV